MPELPEVERGRVIAQSAAAGRQIVAVHVASDPIVLADGSRRVKGALRGRTVRRVRRWGKQLWFELDRPPHPLFHFGMSGAFHVPGGDALQLASGPVEDGVWPPRFVKIHLRFHDDGELVMTDARRLGRILLREDPVNEPPISRLGFDPLLAMPGERELTTALGRRGGVVKSVLLDQSFAAGVGNWMADEALYQAGIDPRRRANRLSGEECARLRRKIRHVSLRGAQALLAGRAYPARWLFHRRWGKKAGMRTFDGHVIEHVDIGGRTTAWVPAVQR